MNPPLSTLGLGELPKNSRARIVSVEIKDPTRYLQMGLIEGETVQILHEAPFGRDPIAVRVRGALIALRRYDANSIRVILED